MLEYNTPPMTCPMLPVQASFSLVQAPKKSTNETVGENDDSCVCFQYVKRRLLF